MLNTKKIKLTIKEILLKNLKIIKPVIEKLNKQRLLKKLHKIKQITKPIKQAKKVSLKFL